MMNNGYRSQITCLCEVSGDCLLSLDTHQSKRVVDFMLAASHALIYTSLNVPVLSCYTDKYIQVNRVTYLGDLACFTLTTDIGRTLSCTDASRLLFVDAYTGRIFLDTLKVFDTLGVNRKQYHVLCDSLGEDTGISTTYMKMLLKSRLSRQSFHSGNVLSSWFNDGNNNKVCIDSCDDDDLLTKFIHFPDDATQVFLYREYHEGKYNSLLNKLMAISPLDTALLTYLLEDRSHLERVVSIERESRVPIFSVSVMITPYLKSPSMPFIKVNGITMTGSIAGSHDNSFGF